MGTCDSCKTAPPSIFCRADSAFLCAACDSRIHSANKLASRHARVWVCEVCERAPATVTCKADVAALCAACDEEIHSANPLSRRHHRLPVVPFYGPAAASAAKSSASTAIADEFSEEEEEAATWFLRNPDGKPEEGPGWAAFKSQEECLFSDSNPFLDLDLISVEQKPKHVAVDESTEYSSCDGVVPVQIENEFESGHILGPFVDGFPTQDVKFPTYNFTSQSISRSVSSSSLEIEVVPDHKSATADAVPFPLSGMEREARVLRYREKRKSRKFEKTIRYASRKAYAETRPRIKGRFAKRSELDADSFMASDDASFCVVPSF